MQGWKVAICVLGVACVQCARELPGDNPSAQARYYFPGRMAVAAGGTNLWVVNTNFDQQFTAGWVTQLSLPDLWPRLAAAQATQAVLALSDVAELCTQGPHVPSLGGDLVIDDAHARAYVAFRGLGLLGIFDVTGTAGAARITCGDPNAQVGLTHLEAKADCGADHLLHIAARLGPSPARLVGEGGQGQLMDPVALALVPAASGYPYLAIGFVDSPYLAVVATAADVGDMGVQAAVPLGQGTLARLVPVPPSAVTSSTGLLLGATHFSPGQVDRGALYSVDVAALMAAVPSVPIVVDRFELGPALGTGPGAADITGMVFSPSDPTRLFVAHHGPDAVMLVQRQLLPVADVIAPGSTAVVPQPSQDVLAVQALAGGRTGQATYLTRSGGDDLLAVASLSHDTIYFFSVADDALALVGRFVLQTGLGPFDMVHLNDGAGRDYLFITAFFGHGLLILDVSSPSPAQFRLAASLLDPLMQPVSSRP